jgi:3-oxoacyl-[acyl-carrier protein] reductase
VATSKLIIALMNKNNKSLKGKVAVITGAGRGIGKAIAKAYAEDGAAVCCVARTVSEIENTAQEIKNSNGKSLAVQADVTDIESIKKVFKKTVDHFGGIDILVINAGVNLAPISVEESDPDKWKDIIDTNLFGSYYCTKYAIPYLKERGAGKIIIIGSYFSNRSSPCRSAYCCSKSGLKMLFQVLAQELWENNISVNELMPGGVKTRLNFKLNRNQIDWLKEPEDVAPLALFLANLPDSGPTGQSYSLYKSPVF